MTSIAYWPHFPLTLSFEAARSGSGKFRRRKEGDNFHSPFSKTNWETKGTRYTIYMQFCSFPLIPTLRQVIFLSLYTVQSLSSFRLAHPPPISPPLFSCCVGGGARCVVGPSVRRPSWEQQTEMGGKGGGSRQLMLFSHIRGENEDLT